MLAYLHIPFCHRVCPYCSFYKHTPGPTPVGRFIASLASEARARGTGHRPSTLYLGGGTPSMLSGIHLTRLFSSLREAFDFSLIREITLEANPATFDFEKARLFSSLGVTRVSLGIQSFSPRVLTTLGREHSPEQAADSVRILRAAGIPSVNIDLMFSIPGQTPDDWKTTLEIAIALRPEHISAYNLTYEEDTAFFDSLKSGAFSVNDDRDADHYHLAEDLLGSAGFDHYETSNYALPGHHSLHNQGYWEGDDYLGLGPSAVSTIQAIRSRNIPDTAAYVEMIESIGSAISETEVLTLSQRRIERIALGLRTTRGIPLSILDPVSLEKAHTLASEKLLMINATHLILSARGRPLVDPIAAELI